MTKDASVRQQCANVGANRRSECVNRVYLYGPDGSDAADLRRRLIANLSRSLLDGGHPAEAPSDDPTLPTGCPPGQGMKPTPGGFGSWSCQALGGELPDDGVSKAFEHEVDEIAVDVATAAVATLDPPLSADDKKRCLGEAAKAVRSLFTGGVPKVHGACRPLSEAARDELARFAKAHVTTYSIDVEAILAGLRRHSGVREKTATVVHSTTDDKKTCNFSSDGPYHTSKDNEKRYETESKKVESYRRLLLDKYIASCSRLITANLDPESVRSAIYERSRFYQEMGSHIAHEVQYGFRIDESRPAAKKYYELALEDQNRVIKEQENDHYQYVYEYYPDRSNLYLYLSMIYSEKTDLKEKIKILNLALADLRRSGMYEPTSASVKLLLWQIKCLETGHSVPLGDEFCRDGNRP